MLIRTMLVGLFALAALSAQPAEPGRGWGRFGGPPPGGGPGGGPGGRFLGAEAGMPGRLVKNAPFTADIVTETTQSLPDGNHIKRTQTVHTSRDSEGRTRQEHALKTLDGLAPNANLPSVVFINDPVAGANYALNSNSRTATKSTFTARPAMAGPGHRGPGPGANPNAAGTNPQGPPNGGRGPRRGAANQNVKTESLGKQTIEGVVADGTRTTMTIPAGQIGNDQPIQVVTETWYSSDLHAFVLTKRTDPRNGETVTRMANVSRAEPPHTLFEVPADYKVSESSRTGRGVPQ